LPSNSDEIKQVLADLAESINEINVNLAQLQSRDDEYKRNIERFYNKDWPGVVDRISNSEKKISEMEISLSLLWVYVKDIEKINVLLKEVQSKVDELREVRAAAIDLKQDLKETQEKLDELRNWKSEMDGKLKSSLFAASMFATFIAIVAEIAISFFR
jgi:DNA repair exonuclease SbcCD ATPase subunit